MKAATYPMKLVPRYVPKPWGGRGLEDRFSRALPAGELIGESWELYDRSDGSSEIANGPLAGRRVADLRGDVPLPLLTKVIDARETLSVQVHPDADAALELGGEEKTEAWYILSSASGAKIYRGLEEGVGAPELVRATREGGVEDLLHSFSPDPGDVVFVPAGTVHAIGAGVMLYEVQQNSDTTYRLHDWERTDEEGRGRELHVHSAVRSTDFTGPGNRRVEPRPISDDGRYRRTIRLSCAAFTIEEQEILGLVTFETERKGKDTWHVVFVLSGEGSIRPFRRRAVPTVFAPGDSILLPAEHERYEIEPRPGRTVRLITAYV